MLITDAGSTKRSIVEAVERRRPRPVGVRRRPPDRRFGAERARTRRAGLFEGRVCVLTPTPRTPPDRLDRARAFWAALGCRVVELDPTAHDEALALTSHLPHAVAAALAASVPDRGPWPGRGRLSRRHPRRRVRRRASGRGSSSRTRPRCSAPSTTSRTGSPHSACALEADDDPAPTAWWEVARSLRGRFDDHGHKPADLD